MENWPLYCNRQDMAVTMAIHMHVPSMVLVKMRATKKSRVLDAILLGPAVVVGQMVLERLYHLWVLVFVVAEEPKMIRQVMVVEVILIAWVVQQMKVEEVHPLEKGYFLGVCMN